MALAEAQRLFGKHGLQNGSAVLHSGKVIVPSSAQPMKWSKHGKALAHEANSGPQVSLSTNMLLLFSSSEPHRLFGKHGLQNGRAVLHCGNTTDPSSAQPREWSKQGPAWAHVANSGPQLSLSTNKALGSWLSGTAGEASLAQRLFGKHGLHGWAEAHSA